MANATLSAQTNLISGATAVTSSVTASGNTVTITGPSGGPLDFNTLAIRVANTGQDAVATIAVSTSFSSLELGTYAVTIGGSSTSYIGGTDFESARFKTATANSLIMAMTSSALSGKSCLCAFEATQAPYSHTG